MKSIHALLVFAVVGSMTQQAHAGGYDTPMLYSARHMGMGGAAIGYVGDPSALFHNPAGLAATGRFSVLADVSILLGRIRGTPDSSAARSAESELTLAPFFLLGGSFRATDWLTFGLGVYPVASAGAEYLYESAGGTPLSDETKLVFFEITPAVAFNLPCNINVGVSYRITLMSIERSVVSRETGNAGMDFKLKGQNFASFRAGIQWTPIDSQRDDAELAEADGEEAADVDAGHRNRLGFGFTYRHDTGIDVSADAGRAINMDLEGIRSSFRLPARFGFGVRGDVGPVGMALDVEYALNSQNQSSEISAAGFDTTFTNVFRWSDAITIRLGGEYRLLDGRLALRIGYVFDGKTANRQFPTAFGTPPAPTHVATIGAGYDGGPWEVNTAYAFRTGGTTIEDDEVDPMDECNFCGGGGEYAVTLHGLYLDFSYDID